MFKFGIDPKAIELIVQDVCNKYALLIYQDAMVGLGNAENIKRSFHVTNELGRVLIWTDNEIAAYIEFGTGNHAKAYLAGKPKEMVDEAIKFFVSGKGDMPAKPYFFPALYRWQGELEKELDARIQEYFDRF